MTYLNDVKKGGETEWYYQNLKIKPEKGLTVIWPSEWTHAHQGQIITKGSKYIITGWLNIPYFHKVVFLNTDSNKSKSVLCLTID